VLARVDTQKSKEVLSYLGLPFGRLEVKMTSSPSRLTAGLMLA
jgi:hypothetical protein